MPNATLRQRLYDRARRLFGYDEPCPVPGCGAETRYDLIPADGRLPDTAEAFKTEPKLWKVCTKCEWEQRRV